MGTVISAYADPNKPLKQHNVWVVYHTSQPKLTFNLLTGLTREELPKPRLRTMEQIEFDQDPNEDDGDYENK